MESRPIKRSEKGSHAKSRGPLFTFRRVYIAVSLTLIILIPTILVIRGDTIIGSVLVGEVIDIQYYNDRFPHTNISYAIKPLNDELNSFGDSGKGSIELNGDVRESFKLGSYYNVEYEKRTTSLYADLRKVKEQHPITTLILVTSVEGGGTLLGGRISSYTLISRMYKLPSELGNQNIALKNSYRGLFEVDEYYNITYFGDSLIGYQKLPTPIFWILRCQSANSNSTIDLMRTKAGDETIVGIDVDGVACSRFTPMNPSEGVQVELIFKVAQLLESGRLYTVSLRMDDGGVRRFIAEGESNSGGFYV